MKLTIETEQKKIEKYRKRFLKGSITNKWICRMTGMSKGSVGHITSKWVEDSIEEYNEKQNNPEQSFDASNFDYLNSIKEHNITRKSVVISDCKGLTRKEIEELVNQIPDKKTLL